MATNKNTSAPKIQAVALSDYDKVMSMTDLETSGRIFYISNISIEDREILEPGQPDKMVPFLTFSVLNENADWIGDVTTRGVVCGQVQRMLNHGLDPDAIVGPVRVTKGGANGRSLYLQEVDEPPF